MIDVTGPKVLIPTILFLAFQFPTQTRSLKELLTRAVALSLAYFVIAKFVLKFTLTKADLVVPAVLFAAVTTAAARVAPAGQRGVTIAVSTLAFATAFGTLRTLFPAYY
jgi:integral membrane sensor domain MASE1